MALLLADPGEADQTVVQSVELDAYDVETLLVSWLGELLYLSEREGCVFTDLEMIEVTTTRLGATIRGRSIHEHRRHIKAVTFSDLEIVQTDTGYETVVVFDV
jgi:SHS2 domain-containing protein